MCRRILGKFRFSALEGSVSYRALARLGTDEGLMLIGVLALLMNSSSYLLFTAGTLGATVAIMGAYYLITSRTCARSLLRDTSR